MDVWLDHFVVAIDELQAGSEAFAEMTGVQPLFGGEHPALGTHNSLVSLGPSQYLEILAPRPGAEVAPMFGEAGRFRTLTPYLWALATDDLRAVRNALIGSGFDADEPVPGARETSEGETLRWSMFAMGPGAPVGSPFFIEWALGIRHPSATSPAGCMLSGYTMDLSGGLARLLDVIGFVGPEASDGAEPTVRLDTPRGVVTLGG